jgi:hypothetical protein
VVIGRILSLIVLLCVGGYIGYTEYEAHHRAAVGEANVEFAMQRLPPEIRDNDRAILRKELENYFAGLLDDHYVPDRNALEAFIGKLNPALVQHEENRNER